MYCNAGYGAALGAGGQRPYGGEGHNLFNHTNVSHHI